MNRSFLVGLLVIGLLIVVAISHQFMGMTANEIAANKPQEHSQEDKEHEEGEGEEAKAKVELPEPMGSPSAPVKVQVYVTSDNTCDTTTLDGMKRITGRFGESVYIEFADLLEDEVLVEAQNAKISCKSGLTINGKSKFILPDRGLKGTILLDGPIGEMNYNLEDVEAIIAHLVEKEQAGRPESSNEAQ